MFSKVGRLSALFFLLIGSVWVYQICFLRQSDIEWIKKLKEEKVLADTKNQFSATSQKREGVRKEIWFSEEEGVRLHYKIESASSLLTFAPKENKIDIVENLENLKFWMQDRIYQDPAMQKKMQQVRFLEADHGIYRITSQEFLAESVKVALFRLPNDTLPEIIDPGSAFLHGLSESIFFSISGKMPQFEAHNFRASLIKGGL